MRGRIDVGSDAGLRGPKERQAERDPVVDTAAVIEDRLRWIAGATQCRDRGGRRLALRPIAEEDRRAGGIEAGDRLADRVVRNIPCARDAAVPIEAFAAGVDKRQILLDVVYDLKLAHRAHTEGELHR